ncbi:MAG: WD40 repeat domain-containing protein [Caldilineaceae bacterium]
MERNCLHSDDSAVRLWDTASKQEVSQLIGHTNGVWSVVFSPDGTQLATAGADSTVRIWDVVSKKEVSQLVGHANGVLSVAFSPDGTQLASAGADSTLRLWDVTSEQKVSQLVGHTDWVWCVAFSPDGTQLASTSDDRTVRLWDVASGQPVAQFAGHTDGVLSVAFSPDGAQLASAGDDGAVRIWDVADAKEVSQFTGHEESIWSVAFSPDGAQLASAGDDGTVRLWDVASGQEVAKLVGHTDGVLSVAFSPDGAQLASAGDDGAIRLWDSPQRVLLRTIARISRPAPILMASERQQFGIGDEVTLPGQAELQPLMNQAKAWELIDQGRSLARTGDIARGVTYFAEALELDPTLHLEPQELAQRILRNSLQTLLYAGYDLARQGSLEAGQAKFEEAASLDTTLNLDELMAKAKELAAAALLSDNRISVATALEASENVTVTVTIWQLALDSLEERNNPAEALRLCQLSRYAPDAATPEAACDYIDIWTPTIAPNSTVTSSVESEIGDLWQTEISEPSQITITLSADNSNLDTYLILYDPQFKIVDQNDDIERGVVQDSELNDVELDEPGTYWIEARRCCPDDDQRSVGAYRLTATVRREE